MRNLTHMTDATGPSPDVTPGRPEEMRERLADYVFALHQAYLRHADLLAPAERATLPLVDDRPLTVAVAAARELHLVATHDRLPAPRGPEVEVSEELAGVPWTVRFFDPSILPELGLVGGADDATLAVRRVLGVADVVYHLTVSIGGGLTVHHAQHAGVALANQHAAAVRDGQSLRRAFPGREAWVDEFVRADRLDLPLSARLLARELAGPALTDTELTGDLPSLRAALLAVGRGERR